MYIVRQCVSFLVTKVNCGKTIYRRKYRMLVVVCGVCCHSELLHWRRCFIGAELRLAADPVCTFFCNRSLSHLIFELYFKLRTVQTALTTKFRDEKLATFFFEFIGRFCWYERWRGKNKLQTINCAQLFFKCFVGIN